MKQNNWFIIHLLSAMHYLITFIPGNMRSSIKNSKMVRLPFPHEVIILLNLIAGKLEKYCYSSQKSKQNYIKP